MSLIKIIFNLILKALNFILKNEGNIKLLITYLEAKEETINNLKIKQFFKSFLPPQDKPNSDQSKNE